MTGSCLEYVEMSSGESTIRAHACSGDRWMEGHKSGRHSDEGFSRALLKDDCTSLRGSARERGEPVWPDMSPETLSDCE